MSPATFRLVLLLSFAHGLVHVFELSLPSVEQLIGAEFGVGRDRTGMLGTAWRLPFGMGALLAGWLADRFGSKPLLLVYLCGCMVMSLLAYWSASLFVLFVVMFSMGGFASLYHPAGLALISRETTPEGRGMALGWHGIVGSLGIAAAPFLAATAFSWGDVTWRQYYLLLVIPAGVLAACLLFGLREHHRHPVVASTRHVERSAAIEEGNWAAFFLLVTIGAMSGFIYAAFMHFLPRYLDSADVTPTGMTPQSVRNYLTAAVLLCGAAGQALGGKLARPGRLERRLPVILLAGSPVLLWMSVAQGRARLWATCTLALVHFMNQPIYNSLVARYVPRSKRSMGYGFSFMMCFGIGALGPACAGLMKDDRWTYGGLAVIAAVAGLLATVLWRRNDGS